MGGIERRGVMSARGMEDAKVVSVKEQPMPRDAVGAIEEALDSRWR